METALNFIVMCICGFFTLSYLVAFVGAWRASHRLGIAVCLFDTLLFGYITFTFMEKLYG